MPADRGEPQPTVPESATDVFNFAAGLAKQRFSLRSATKKGLMTRSFIGKGIGPDGKPEQVFVIHVSGLGTERIDILGDFPIASIRPDGKGGYSQTLFGDRQPGDILVGLVPDEEAMFDEVVRMQNKGEAELVSKD